MKPQYATISTGMCKHCTHCNVQTGIGWVPVYFCALDDSNLKSVEPNGGCGAYSREPGVDDEC